MTPTVTEVKIPVFPRYTSETVLTGYLIEDIFTDHEFQILNRFWEQSSSKGIDWDKSIYYYKGKARGVANQRTFSERYDRKIVDLPEKEEWQHQTPESVYEWSYDQISKNVNPIIMRLIDRLVNCKPLVDEKDKWVPQRIILNRMDVGQNLGAHFDSEPSYYNCRMEEVRQYSVTMYLNELSHGGEFWIDSNIEAGYPGFYYKPKPNTAFIFNGGYTWHGVNENQDKDGQSRRAFTIRFAHIDSLYLPGSPDKHLYKTNLVSQITS
jgi:hypothetical protein